MTDSYQLRTMASSEKSAALNTDAVINSHEHIVSF